jgi:formylglycine-generating enzyme required for sulfatase activity
MTTNRPLRVFLCHSSNDKPAVRELYQKLHAESWIQPWLDEEELYPGQDWNMEIEKAVETADAIIVCLTKNSINKEGYVQRELRIVLDFADYKPEGTLYIIPVRLEECEPPRRLRAWQYADYFEGQRERAFQRLLVSLKSRAETLGLKFEEPEPKKEEETDEKKLIMEVPVEIKKLNPEPVVEKKQILETPKPAQAAKPKIIATTSNKLVLANGMEFMRVPAGKFLMGSDNHDDNEIPEHTVNIPYDYWMARFPVTNEFYNSYIKAAGITHPVAEWEKKKDHPVVYVEWTDAIEYCKWLNSSLDGKVASGFVLRLPTEAEWEKAARGTDGHQYPWGKTFDENRCNSRESDQYGTTPIKLYFPRGNSPYGCADMTGNVWEWLHSLQKPYPYKLNDGRENEKVISDRVIRGGSFNFGMRFMRCSFRNSNYFSNSSSSIGFRIVIAPPLPK